MRVLDAVALGIDVRDEAPVGVVLVARHPDAARIDDVFEEVFDARFVGVVGRLHHLVGEALEIAVGVVAVSHAGAVGRRDRRDPSLAVARECQREALAVHDAGIRERQRAAVGFGDLADAEILVKIENQSFGRCQAV